MAIFRSLLTILVIISSLVSAQDYTDYGDGDGYAPDSIYYDYATKQVDKQAGKGGHSLFKLLGTFGAGYFACSKFGCRKLIKKLKKKQTNEQKELYSQYFNDVYKLQEQSNELYDYVAKLESALKLSEEERELDALQRDMEEFKQPDIDGDGRISRSEFNHYVKNYLANYPGLTEKDYPRFEDFDHDSDGHVSFQEYAQQMAFQVQKAELDNSKKEQAGLKRSREAEKGLQGLYKETNNAGNINELYAQLRKKA
jgi:Ca2+-binding EF-hand superfamily protein